MFPFFQVWVRGRRGYPINIGDGKRLFVINEWDVAIRLASPQASGTGDNHSNAPPPYQEKPPLI
jgi:hypothetical protein